MNVKLFKTVTAGRATYGSLEEFAEERGIGEMQAVAHLLNRVFLAFQQGFSL